MEKLVEKELRNPIVKKHSFEPFGSKFGKENINTQMQAPSLFYMLPNGEAIKNHAPIANFKKQFNH